MNISFLVGNGFDIASGIDTSYSAFYKWYCSQTSGKPHIDAFKRDIKNDMDNGGENWADFEIGLGRYTAKFTTETVNDFIECYEDAQDNIAEYLEKECKKFSGSISDTKSQELREGVAKFYQELPPAELNKFEKILKSDEPNNSTIQLSVFDKGIITRHLKNGANLHQTAAIGENSKRRFFLRYGRGLLGAALFWLSRRPPADPGHSTRKV